MKCSAGNVRLPNDTKIRFCNAVDGMKAHCILCKECDIYMRWGDGDLCSAGKTIIAMELCYVETNVEFPPNDELCHSASTTNQQSKDKQP